MKYHISKFNPKNYDEHGVYKLKEWDSIYDIGSEFNGKVFKEEDYISVENSYIDAILKIADSFGVKTFRVVLLEKNYHNDGEFFMKRRIASVILYVYTVLKLLFFSMVILSFWLYEGYRMSGNRAFMWMLLIFSVELTAYIAFLGIGKKQRNIWDYIITILVFVWANFCLIQGIVIILTKFAIYG